MSAAAAPELRLDQVPAIARGVRLQWEEVPQTWVLLYPEGRVNLNGSAAEIMRRVNGQASIGAIVADLQRAFSATNLGADVLAALALALTHGWIEVRDAA